MPLTPDLVIAVCILVALVLIVVGIHVAAPVDRPDAVPAHHADVAPRRTLS